MAKSSRATKTAPTRRALELEAYLEIARVSDLFLGECAQLFKEYDLTAPGYNILRILRGARPDGLPCSEIAARMINRDPDITRLVDRLEKLGFARRERATTDRRVVNIHITPAGLDQLDELDEPVIELHRMQFAHMKKEEIAQLFELLERARSRGE